MRLQLAAHLVPYLLLAAACGSGLAPAPFQERSTAISGGIAQSCTSLTIRGTPVGGTVCGGSTHALDCSAGAIYKCRTDTTTNNCTLDRTCTSGCVTGSGSQLNDSCFSGTPPLAISSSSTPGGSDVTATVSLADAHPRGAIVNMRIDRGDLVAARASCNVPDLAAGTTSASFAMPTAVVTSPSPVVMYTDLSYADGSGVARELVSHAVTLTLNPGGTAPPPPPLASLTLTPSTVAAGGVSFMDVVLQKMAPASGVQISATSSDPSVASIISGGQPFVFGGCTSGGGAETIQASKSVATQTTVNISASSGAVGQAPLTRPLTVTAGCSPKTCLDLPPSVCSAADGCGGTLACGCNLGLTCGGGGTPGMCGSSPTLSVSSLALAPASVQGGTSSTATVALSMPAPAGGAGVFLSSSSASAVVPQSVVVPEGQSSASFTIATNPVSSTTASTIAASLGGTQSATLTITSGAGAATGSSRLTLTAQGRSGVTVTSKPAGVSVAVGTTGTASFASGTAVTLGLSDRTAVWSGACATPRDTSTCTFTITGDAAVVANVQ